MSPPVFSLSAFGHRNDQYQPTDPIQSCRTTALAELWQETAALTRRLFLQLIRRRPPWWLVCFNLWIWLIPFALFAKAPEGLLPGG